VERVELHLNGGSPIGRTVASLPARVGQIVTDFYLFQVMDGTDALVFLSVGVVDPEMGDFVVESLD